MTENKKKLYKTQTYKKFNNSINNTNDEQLN